MYVQWKAGKKCLDGCIPSENENPAVFVRLSFYGLVFVRGCKGAHRRARLPVLSAFVCGDYCLPSSCYYTMKHDFPISSGVTSLPGSHPNPSHGLTQNATSETAASEKNRNPVFPLCSSGVCMYLCVSERGFSG